MDWPLITVVAWNMLIGASVGYNFGQSRARPKRSTADQLLEEAVNDVRNMEVFAGLQAVSRTLLTDRNGEKWIVTVERETA